MVDPGEEPAIKAHIIEEAGLSGRMTKWVDLPSDSRGNIELSLKELMAPCHLVDHVLVVWGSLIIHAHSSIDELQLPILHQILRLLLPLLVLVLVPPVEEGHLNIYEGLFLIIKEFSDNTVYGILYPCKLYVVLVAVIVLIGRL